MSVSLGELLALTAALCGAVSSVLYNFLGKKTDSDILAYTRMLIALPIMGLYALLKDGFVINSSDIHSVVVLFISGIIGFFITDLFMFRSFVLWGARETMVVMCLAPVFSGIFAFLIFNEHLSVLQIIGSLCSVLGIVIMTAGSKKSGHVARVTLSLSALYAFLAAFLQSVSDMTAKFALVDFPWVTSASLRALGGAIAWIVFGFIRRKTFFANFSEIKRPNFFCLLVLTVLIGTAMGTTMAMGALKYAPAGIVTSLKQISPVFILPYEVAVLKRKLSFADIIGTVISVCGVFLLF